MPTLAQVTWPVLVFLVPEGHLRPEDEREPLGLDRPCRFASEVIPASATTTTSCSGCAVRNALRVGIIFFVSAVLPSYALTINGSPEASVSSPIWITGSTWRSLLNPRTRNPSSLSVSNHRFYADVDVTRS